MRQRLRSERGFTVVELAIASALGAVVLALAAGAIVVVYRVGSFTQGQGFTLNDARNAMQQMEKEIRGADFVNWCTPAGSCIEVGAQTVAGGFRTVRYTHDSGFLKREMFDQDNQTWSDPQDVINRVVNPNGQPVFACDTQSTLLRVTVNLIIEPTPQSNPNLNLHTSIRPRNFPSKQNCP